MAKIQEHARNGSIRTPDVLREVCKVCCSLISETQLSYGIRIIARNQHQPDGERAGRKDRWSLDEVAGHPSRISPVDEGD